MAKNLVEKNVKATITESKEPEQRSGSQNKLSKGLRMALSMHAQACSPSARVQAVAAQVARQKRKFGEVGCRG